ncbi:MAG: hypothetical protein P794_06575 [Epsilonproteobacteria bacterium (ex Lamellibrachia satsuma)]|nr:MAG: hypothetical protein P794_06575 [Epsilonproteobacteria bacterium (ex Lamellibrachia satsuma)]
MEYHSRLSDRRRASTVKPLVYLVIEAIILGAVCWFVSYLNILILTVLVCLGAIYFFLTSSLPRYNKIIKRQKNSKH